MVFTDIKRRLVWLHRWLALGLAPLLLLVTLTGGILAFVPVTESLAPADSTRIDSAALLRTINGADPEGKATMVMPADGGSAVTLVRDGLWQTYALEGGQLLREAPPPFDFFHTVEGLHRNLLIGAGILVEIAAWAMLAITVIGPLLAWPRFANSLMGWHRVAGWVALPLVLMLPLTGVLMTLGIGGPSLPPATGGPTTPVAALTRAADSVDLSDLTLARSFRQGRVLITTSAPATYVATATEIAPLTGGPGLVRELHEGTWAGAWSGLLNAVGAAVLFGLTATGILSWWRRRRADRARSSDQGARILIAHASHTGTAAALAHASAEALRRRGDPVACAALGAVDPAELAGYETVLLIASTTGEGELPDSGRRFLAALGTRRLDGVRYRMLALGDRRYAHFCGGAHRLDEALIAAGARPAAPMACADGDPAATWRDWLDAQFPGLELGALPAADRKLSLTLESRTLLTAENDDEVSESWHIVLTADEDLDYRPGDLLMFAPPGAAPRSYSIGSAEPRRIGLTVGLARYRDADGQEHFGLASGLLCRGLALGSRIEAALHRHEAFRAPADLARPLVMIAGGCGVAPFIGFIDERRGRADAGPSWLIFGCRKQEGDFLHRARLEADLADGTLTRLSTAFSREGERLHVQDRMRAEGRELCRWLVEDGAFVRVCGRSDLGLGVEAALADVLVDFGGRTREAARVEIEGWRQSGRLAFDLFG
ncbi:PepSY domain-containing protein [Zavarzinia aquatilis]|nr:PepSY domain-containing protein [Zavarzinia aquatilis]